MAQFLASLQILTVCRPVGPVAALMAPCQEQNGVVLEDGPPLLTVEVVSPFLLKAGELTANCIRLSIV